LKPKIDSLSLWTFFVRSDSKNEYENFIGFIKNLRKFYRQEIDLNGTVGVSFNSDFSENIENTRIGTNFEIDKGVFPIEADFSASFQTIFQENLVQQRVSDIDVSIDYHPFKKSPVFETYAYANRYADSFLGFDQRFEVGSGFIFNWYTGKFTDKGKDNEELLDKIDFDQKKKTEYNEALIPDEIISVFDLKDEDVDNLAKAQDGGLQFWVEYFTS